MIGLVGGLGATVSAGYAMAALGILHQFGFVYAGILVAAALLLWHSRQRRLLDPTDVDGRTAKQRPTPNSLDSPEGGGAWWAAVALCFIIGAESIPTLSTDVPLGWDPSFHSILAQKILNSGSISEDWLPFEDIPVNYSQGFHVLVALVADGSGQQVHQVLQVMHLVFQPLAAVLVYLLAVAVSGEWRVGVLAMLSYAFLFHFGSFSSYYQWGGFPTELGSLLFLTLVWSAMDDSFGDGGQRAKRNLPAEALRVLLFGSLMLVHNLSALIATTVILFYALTTALSGSLTPLARRLIRVLPLAAVAYSFYFVPYVRKVTRLGGTDAVRFHDEPLSTAGQIVSDLGVMAFALGVLGLVTAGRRYRGGQLDFPLAWLTALVAGFCLLDYVYRFTALWLLGENLTAFTPSRWMTVTSYPLSIFAGVGLAGLCRQLRGLLRQRVLVAERFDVVLAGLVFALTVPAALDIQELTSRRSIEPGVFRVAESIKQATPENAFIIYTRDALNTMKPIDWLPYLTWRPSPYVPIPASEARDAVRAKRRLFTFSDLPEISAWLSQRNLQGYVLSAAGDGEFRLSRLE